MKCKVCGAELRNEGDICKNCYAEMLEYEELEKDTKVIYKLKPKFIPIYEILKDNKKTINEIDSTIESICEFLRERSYPEPEIIRALAILITARARIWKINT